MLKNLGENEKKNKHHEFSEMARPPTPVPNLIGSQLSAAHKIFHSTILHNPHGKFDAIAGRIP